MTPQDLLRDAVVPAVLFLTGYGVRSDDRALVLMMAIAGQESGWAERRQIGCFIPGVYQEVGARGFWQCERGGAVAAVVGMPQFGAVCDHLHVPCNGADVYEAIAWNDFLAASLARLNLWRDPEPLPAVGDVDGAHGYYIRTWAPGRPWPQDWLGNYAKAVDFLKGAAL